MRWLFDARVPGYIGRIRESFRLCVALGVERRSRQLANLGECRLFQMGWRHREVWVA